MRKPILSLLLFLPVFLGAQHEFAPLGATWYYHQNDWQSSAVKIIKLEVTAIDTLLGHPCKRIENADYACSDAHHLLHIYEENGKVYRLVDSVFYLFLDFTAVAGQQWNMATFPFDTPDFLAVRVDSISYIHLANNDSLRVQHISYSNYTTVGNVYMAWGSRIIECLGSDGFMCPQFGACDPQISSLFCYADPIFQEPFDCVAHLAAHEAPENFQKGILFPNPASEVVNIRSGLEADEVIFQNIFGKQQKRMEINSDKSLVIKGLAPGLYLASFFQKGVFVAFDKLVIF